MQLYRGPGIDFKEIDSAKLYRGTLTMRKNKIFGEKTLKVCRFVVRYLIMIADYSHPQLFSASV